MKIKIKATEAFIAPINKLKPNKWNPNKVAHTEMELLKLSIVKSGFCFPIVCIEDKEEYMIVDGYHRYLAAKKLKMKGVPIVLLDDSIEELMNATIRFNRARGTHQIQEMANIVTDLIKKGINDSEIMKNMGMSQEEVLRLKQKSGLKEAFNNHEFSKSWIELLDNYESRKKV